MTTEPVGFELFAPKPTLEAKVDRIEEMVDVILGIVIEILTRQDSGE
jgi:hypothetical protein